MFDRIENGSDDQNGNGHSSTADVCLVSMPYPVIDQPSMALGLLKAALTAKGVSAKTFYPCVRFAEVIGLDVFSLIADSKQEFLIGEWTFAGAAFPDHKPDQDAYLRRVLSAAVSQGLLARSGFRGDPWPAVWKARDAAPGFVDRTAREVLAHNPRIVGCTSTFFQHCASLALLRRIRELDPTVITVLGGANCEGSMGVVAKRAFDWVDFVVSGEADVLFPALCKTLLEKGRDLPASDLAPGVVSALNCHETPTGEAAPRASVFRMDDVPAPDYDDYFDTLATSPLRAFISPGLPVETSRGCWWGAKKHCTFCGLNGGNMSFRSKSAQRVLDELEGLSSHYGVRKFNVVDNILDMKYLRDLLPELAQREPYTLFFETKANLRREQLESIAQAGIRRLQPGIESMHDEILKLVEKGTTGLQNVQLLKWARELGIFITWNFLWDVPGENDEMYGEMADWLPLVSHLQPPGIDRIQFHRFSPYHRDAKDFGLQLTPFPSYETVYPLPPEQMAEFAYYFDDTRRGTALEALQRRPHLKRVMQIVAHWNRHWGYAGGEKGRERPLLLIEADGPDGMTLRDSRPGFEATHSLSAIEAQLYRLCDSIRTPANLSETTGAPTGEITKTLDALVRRKVMLHTSGKYLSLALREVRRIPDASHEFPGGFTNIEAWQQSQSSVTAAE